MTLSLLSKGMADLSICLDIVLHLPRDYIALSTMSNVISVTFISKSFIICFCFYDWKFFFATSVCSCLLLTYKSCYKFYVFSVFWNF